MKFTINGTEYEGAKYDFNTHCEFDAMGVNPLMIKDNPLPVIRAYLAISSGMSLTDAGKELEQHFINGGQFEEIVVDFVKELNESDFFMALVKKATVTETKPKRSKTTKKSE